MLIAGFRLQPDFDRDAQQIAARAAAFREIGAHLENIALAGGEIDVDRIELDDGGRTVVAFAPTNWPMETCRAETTPSNGAVTLV